MNRILPAAFLAFWSAALAFPQVARIVLRRTGAVSWAAFDSAGEKRNSAPYPTLRKGTPRSVAPAEFGRAWESWYGDALPWRTELLLFHRDQSFRRLKTPVGREVPGHGNWVFRRGGDWPELDDYLGAKELSPAELADWIVLFEGRREWGRAIGAAVLEVPAVTKAQARWQELYPAIRRHRGNNVAAQVREALADSPARDDVLFADDDFAAAFAAGRETFFDRDHHPNAYGEWLLYDRINRRLRELFPDRIGETPPWYDEPPPAVLAGEAPGCWRRSIRLEVSVPGEVQDDDGVVHNAARYPYCNVATKREGGGISVLLAHDSFMRFSLASWRGKDGDVRFPFAKGVGRVRALIFQRFSPGFLEGATAHGIPDVLVEQFPACRLDASVSKYLDAGTRAAAAFGRAEEPPAGRPPRAGDRIAARAVFGDVRAGGRARPVAVLRCGGAEIARRDVPPGVKRAAFFDVAELPSDGPLEVSLEGGSAASADLVWRLARRP